MEDQAITDQPIVTAEVAQQETIEPQITPNPPVITIQVDEPVSPEAQPKQNETQELSTGSPQEVIETEKQIGNTSPDKPWLWKPGQSGNPNGRPPKEHSLTDSLKEALTNDPDIKSRLISKTISLAIDNGDIQAIKLLWSYLDGMPQQEQIMKLGEGAKIIVTDK